MNSMVNLGVLSNEFLEVWSFFLTVYCLHLEFVLTELNIDFGSLGDPNFWIKIKSITLIRSYGIMKILFLAPFKITQIIVLIGVKIPCYNNKFF